MHRPSFVFAFVACLLLTSSCVAKSDGETLRWRVTATLEHDPTHYTQGLFIHDDYFIETTGLYGRSALMIKARDTGALIRAQPLPPQWFAEGAAMWKGRIVVLTWREQIAQWFDMDLQPLARMHFAGEGWGITHDGKQLIMSNGTSKLQFRDPEDFTLLHERDVRDRGIAVSRLNELEYARGLVFANVWQTDRIAAIDPSSGEVRAWLDLRALRQRFEKPPQWDPIEHVLNGIAYDAERDRFYVTGKCWPLMFEIDVAQIDEQP